MVHRKSREHVADESVVAAAHHVHDANVSRRALSTILMILAVLPTCLCTPPRPPPPPSIMFTERRGTPRTRNMDHSPLGFHHFCFAPAAALSAARRVRTSCSTTHTGSNTGAPLRRIGRVDRRRYYSLDGRESRYFCRSGMPKMSAGRSQDDTCLEPCGGALDGPVASSATRKGFLKGFGSSVILTSLLAGATTVAGGPREAFSSVAASERMSIQDIKKAVEKDFVTGRYYVTGDLTPSLYRSDCLFTDPTTRVSSVEKYTNAVKLLFDPDNAQVDLLSLEIEDDSHLFARWRLQGYLKFPWHPYVAPYTGTTRYSVDSDGLIYSHEETWSISALDAAKATITPTAGPPPAVSGKNKASSS